MMYIPVILGTARLGRQSEEAAQFMLQKAIEANIDSEIIDVREYRLPATDNSKESPQARKLAEKVERADGLIIVSPEYNHGYPGELKMMLDMLFSEFSHKQVGICAVSSGLWGGVRMVEPLRLVCLAAHMVPTGEAVYFPRVQELFDDQGQLLSKLQHSQASRLLDELIWHAKSMSAAGLQEKI